MPVLSRCILAFAIDFRAPSIPRFSAEWVGYRQNSGLHNFRKSAKLKASAGQARGEEGKLTMEPRRESQRTVKAKNVHSMCKNLRIANRKFPQVIHNKEY
jgi:hypothetical protein